MTNELADDLTLDQATEIARQAIADLGDEHDFVLLEDRTVEHDFGWVFRYDAKAFLETGDLGEMVPGVGPVVVERERGKVVFLSTAGHPDQVIRAYEEQWRAEREDGS